MTQGQWDSCLACVRTFMATLKLETPKKHYTSEDFIFLAKSAYDMMIYIVKKTKGKAKSPPWDHLSGEVKAVWVYAAQERLLTSKYLNGTS